MKIVVSVGYTDIKPLLVLGVMYWREYILHTFSYL